MLKLSIMFFIVAFIAGVLGFGGVASTSANIAGFLFWLFLAIFVVTLICGLLGLPKPKV